MKCVILAAGASTRLHPLTASLPKCLLKVGQHTILGRAIQNVLLQGISEFVIATGFQEERIQSFVKKAFPSLHVEFIHNRRFAETNNAYSLVLTQQALRKEELLLLDSDLVFDPRILEDVLSSPYENCLAVRTRGTFDREEIKVMVDRDWKILKIGKGEAGASSPGESLGIEKFSELGVKGLFEILHRRIFVEGRENEFYEASFQELMDTGIPIHAVDAKDRPCIEIDTLADLRIAREVIAGKLDRM